MQFFIQLLINGFVVGALYAIVSLGYSITLNLNINNFAHGSLVMIGSFFSFILLKKLHLSFLNSIILILLFSSFISLIFYYLFIKRIIKNNNWLIIIAITFSISLILDNLILLMHGFELFSIRNLFNSHVIYLFQTITITNIQVLFIVLSIILYFTMNLIIKKTTLGLKFQAITESVEASSIMGINSNNYLLLSMIMGGVLASLSGLIIAMDYDQNSFSGIYFLMIAYTSTIIGGINKLFNIFFAAYLLGISESFITGYISSEYSLAAVFVILILFLLINNEGLNNSEITRLV